MLSRVLLPALAGFVLAGVSGVKAAGQGATLSVDQGLTTGQYLESANAQYSLLMQSDGNLVLYASGRPLWDTRTVGSGGMRTVMQTDGNLVVYGAASHPAWASNTWGHPGATLRLGTDGDLSILAPDGGGLWSTATSDWVLLEGEGLSRDQYLQPPARQYTLLMQSDGNLVLYVGGRPLWDTRTAATTATRAAMQSDGNLVLYDATNVALWASNTWGHPGATLGLGTDGNVVISSPGGTTLWATWTADSMLLGGEALGEEQYLEPPTRQFSLLMQSDGNLVLYSTGHPLWDTGTVGHSGAHVAMQTDGNLVVSSPGGSPLWASNTWGHPGAHLTLGSDGTIMIEASDGTRLWARATGGWNVQLAAPLIRQERNLDCEAAALRIALGSRGTSVSESWILNQVGADTRHALMSGSTVVRWGNPWNTFVGNVDGAEWNGSGYGVYYPPIVMAAERAGRHAVGGQGWSSSDVFDQLVLGHPVVIWTMQNFQAAAMNHYTAWDGQVIPWRVGEHAVTLTGVNSPAGTVTLIDPLDGRQKTFSIAQFLSFWSSFGNMAVAVD